MLSHFVFVLRLVEEEEAEQEAIYRIRAQLHAFPTKSHVFQKKKASLELFLLKLSLVEH